MKFTIHREKSFDTDDFWLRIEVTTDGGASVSAEGNQRKLIFFKYGEPSNREKLDLAEFILRHANERPKDYPRPDSDGAL